MSRRPAGLWVIAAIALSGALLCPAAAGSSPARLGKGGESRGGEVAVRRTVIAHDVVDGEPVWSDVPFIDDGEPIYVFLEVDNGRAAPLSLAVSVSGRARSAGPMRATVPARARGWHTWVTLPAGMPAGEFTATVRTLDGRVLDEVSFEVEG